MTTARDIITDALSNLGIIAIDEVPTAAETSRAFRVLNQMIESWSLDSLYVYSTIQTVFNYVAGQKEYTLGTGGNFNIDRPVEIVAAYNRINGIDYPIQVTTNTFEYAMISAKELQSAMPFVLYDDGNFPLKTLSFYPVPIGTAYQPVLWTSGKIDSVDTLDSIITLPPGYKRAIEFNLSVELCPAFEKVATADLLRVANEAKIALYRINTSINQLSIPSSLPGMNKRAYSLAAFYAGT
jgi:hypothetical protein